MAEELSEDELLADLRRVAEDLGEPPSTDQYRHHGRYTVEVFYNHFDGFVAAREEAGLGEGELRPNTREELLEDIRRVAEEVAGEPTYGEYEKCGEYAISGITYRFDSWNAAKKEAGVYREENHELTRDVLAEERQILIEDMKCVDSEVSGPLSQRRYNEYGRYTSKTVQRRFGSWETACQLAGVSRPDMGPQNADNEGFFEDVSKVAEKVSGAPTRSQYHEHGEFSAELARTRFGSWATALREAGFEPREPGGQPGEDNSNWEGGYDPYYGPNWAEKRRKARRRDGYECQSCGMGDDQHKERLGCELEVHHIVPAREFDDYGEMNKLGNLITLCTSCHQEYERLPAEECEKLKS